MEIRQRVRECSSWTLFFVSNGEVGYEPMVFMPLSRAGFIPRPNFLGLCDRHELH